MRITRPLSFVIKQTTTTLLRKTTAGILGVSLLIASVIAGQNLLTTPQSASALTPPDSCFAFDSASGAITNYYENENNDSGQPACPKAVDIPATIGGTAVTGIGDYAFNGKQLTALTVPNSVVTFGDSIFSGNPITSITYNSTTYTDSTPLVEQCFTFNTGTITKYNQFDMNLIKNSGIACMQSDFTIPSTIGGVPVTGILGNFPYAYAFGFTYLNSVIIPDSVTNIGSGAFFGSHLSSVNIPASMTSISDGPFRYTELTSITIPDTVTTIGDYAFYESRLTSVTIPDSVTNIGSGAFLYNNLTSVTIPNSVTTIGSQAFAYQSSFGREIRDELSSGDPARRQAALDSIYYTRLYTADPSNPNSLTDDAYTQHYDEPNDGYDANGDGDQIDIYDENFGGHLINPTAATLSFKNEQGTDLQPSQTFTGQLANDTYLANYLVSQGPTVPAPGDFYDPTPEELQAIQDALTAYHRLSDQVTVTAPAITGYSTITPTSPHTLTLTQPETTLAFTYSKGESQPEPRPVTTVDFSAPSGSASNPTADSVPSGTSQLVAGSTLGFAAGSDCQDIDSARLIAQDMPNTPAGYETVGGLSFVLNCTTPGDSSTVKFSLGGSLRDTDLSQVKVFKENNGTTTDITSQVTITNQSTPQGMRTVVSYTLRDGQALDDDGVANGTITDPIYLVAPDGATSGATLIGAPNAGAGAGFDIRTTIVILFVALAALAVCTTLLRKTTRSSHQRSPR